LEGGYLCIFENDILVFASDSEESNENLSQDRCNLADIQTKYFLNKNIECYNHTKLLSHDMILHD
jgi:hypothetical protein